MMRVATLGLAALLAACGSTPPPRPLVPPSPQEQACAAQADKDPAVEQSLGIAAGRLDWQFKNEGEITQIKRDAITRCLRARGLAPPGGVERPR